MKYTLGKAALTAAIALPIAGFLPLVVSANTTILVTPANMQGWSFVNDTTNGIGSGVIVSGPATPPLGIGSAQLTATSTTDGQVIALAIDQGIKLSSLTNLTYSTYQSISNPSNATAIALQFNVDKDVTDTDNSFQGRIIFEPYLNNGGTVPLGSWNTWDALDSGNGVWWLSSQGSTKFNNTCTQAAPCTLNQIISDFPNIGIHPTFGAVVLKAGSGWASFLGNVDNLTIGVNGTNTTYDFDPTPVTLPAPVNVSPANGATLTTAQWDKADWTDVTDSLGGIQYFYESSNSSALNSDGSFVSPIFQSGALTISEIPTPNTPAGTYFWHARARDAGGNFSPWSSATEVIVDNSAPTTGSLTVEKDTIGGDGIFAFTGSVGNFQITTAHNTGSTTFSNLAPGTYTITEVAKDGWTETDTACANVTITAGGTTSCTIVNTKNAPGTNKLGAILGTKYQVGKDNGKGKDKGHHPLAGVTIYLDQNNDGALDNGEPTSVTDKHGNYRFLGLAAGTYHVREVVQSGWQQVTPASGVYDVTLRAGQVVKHDDFANKKITTITHKDKKDKDNDGDNDKDDGKKGNRD